MYCTGFPYAAQADARILILGSMPGTASLEHQQYYAHPRNAFWSVMESLFSIPRTADYQERLELLKARRIALWDVLQHCYREGSLDTAIDVSTIKANDFASFFSSHRHIRAVFFNGKKARSMYQRYVAGTLPAPYNSLPCTVLPSTSPAHASMKTDEKIRCWRAISRYLQT